MRGLLMALLLPLLVGLAAAPPPPPPCPVAAPAGFTAAPRHGWYETTPIPKPSEEERHGVSVACCAAFCVADAECQGFEVFKPCGISDCYNFHAYSKTNFTANTGAHTFTRPAGQPTGPPAPPHCSARGEGEGVLCGHKVVLDDTKKIMPWSADNQTAGGGPGAYEHAARLAWSAPLP